MVSSWLLFQQMCSLFPRESGNSLGWCCAVSVSHGTAACSVPWGSCWAPGWQGSLQTAHPSRGSWHQRVPRAGLAAGQSSGAALCHPLGSSLLLSKGRPLGCSETWACSASERGGIIRKYRSSKAISPVQCSREEFLLYLLPPQGSALLKNALSETVFSKMHFKACREILPSQNKFTK